MKKWICLICALVFVLSFAACEDERIKILPALPDELKSGKLTGVIAKGNIKLDIEWKDGKCVSLKAISPVSQKAVFEINGEKLCAELKADVMYSII